MTSFQSDLLFLLKFFINLAAMERAFNKNLDDVLSRCTEFDHMEGKFIAKKTSESCPRIMKLKKDLGFAPDESLNSSNFHRLISGAKGINNILRKRKCYYSPLENIQERKSFSKPPNEAKLVQHFRVHRAKRPTIPAIRRIKSGWKSLSDGEYSSNSSSDSDSKDNFPSSNVNKRCNGSFINSSNPYSSKDFDVSRPRKSLDFSKLNKEPGFPNLKKGLNALRSMKDFPVPQSNTPIVARILNTEMKYSNSSMNFGEASFIQHNEAADSSMDLSFFNSDKYLSISDINKSSTESQTIRNISHPKDNFSISKLKSFETQSCYSVLSKDLEISSSEDEKENLHEVVL